MLILGGVADAPMVHATIPRLRNVPQGLRSESERLVANYRQARQLLDEIAALNLGVAATSGAERVSVHGGRCGPSMSKPPGDVSHPRRP